MWKRYLLLLAACCCSTLAGCGGTPRTDPITADEDRELQEQLERVQETERSQFAPGAPD